MGRFKDIKGLIAKVADMQALINIEDPCELMELRKELKTLCLTISTKVVECERRRTEERRLGLDRDIGNVRKPVHIGPRFEGFKFRGAWTYRNSNPDKTVFCTRWLTIGDAATIADFDALYVESLGNEEETR